MPIIDANGTLISYERYGKQGDPVVLLIMGLGAQLTYWSPDFIDALTASGREVIAFDNRDVGLSQKWKGHHAPNAIRQMLRQRLGRPTGAPYSLKDMAKDTIGLMDALELKEVDLVGVSLGGMISQFVSAMAPERVRSFTGIMTTTGNPKHPKPNLKIMRGMIFRSAESQDMDSAVERTMRAYAAISTPGENLSTNGTLKKIMDGHKRSHYPPGFKRQMAASIESGYFIKMTKAIKAPTLVIHGSADPLVSVEGGKEIARTVPGAELMIVEGMGHDMPPRFIGDISKRVIQHMDNALVAA